LKRDFSFTFVSKGERVTWGLHSSYSHAWDDENNNNKKLQIKVVVLIWFRNPGIESKERTGKGLG
jgi:hypothetical protein